MIILTEYVVSPALYREIGIEAQGGDQVRLWLDQGIGDPILPASVVGVIQPGIITVCNGKSYSVEYDETDLDSSGVDRLTPDMILLAEVISEAQLLFANAVRFDAPQDLSVAEQEQARENIGILEMLNPPYAAGIPYPASGYVDGFTMFSDVLTVNSTGIYVYAGSYLGCPLYRHNGATVSVTDDVITGDGYAFFVGGTAEVPYWQLFLFTSGTPTDYITAEVYPVTQYSISPVDAIAWADGAPTFSDSSTIEGSPIGVVGQVAVGYPFGQWELFMCYRTNPTVWKQLSFNPAILTP